MAVKLSHTLSVGIKALEVNSLTLMETQVMILPLIMSSLLVYNQVFTTNSSTEQEMYMAMVKSQIPLLFYLQVLPMKLRLQQFNSLVMLYTELAGILNSLVE